jgi:hypothetical protein
MTDTTQTEPCDCTDWDCAANGCVRKRLAAKGELPVMKCIIMDIDGTLADASHRIHLLPKHRHEDGVPPDQAWREFYLASENDAVIEEIRILNNKLAEEYLIVLCTGRSDHDRDLTVNWLKRHDIRWDYLRMRRSGDHRPDTVVKKEMLDDIRASGFRPLFAVEDRAGVTKMWRENGVRCLQVCDGDY